MQTEEQNQIARHFEFFKSVDEKLKQLNKANPVNAAKLQEFLKPNRSPSPIKDSVAESVLDDLLKPPVFIEKTTREKLIERYSNKFIQLPSVRSNRHDKNGSANLEPSFLRKAKLRQEMLEARK